MRINPLFIFAVIIAVTIIGFTLQLIKSWFVRLVYRWEKKHCERDNQWIYKI